jgi:hypothetical protein
MVDRWRGRPTIIKTSGSRTVRYPKLNPRTLSDLQSVPIGSTETVPYLFEGNLQLFLSAFCDSVTRHCVTAEAGPIP